MTKATVGEALVAGLQERGVTCVFGIPGVHTVELYRGLAGSGIRHVTPRHEQGAGFMADGYARVSGQPGVAFVITGPGLTNTLTPMAQARADSVPMLVVSGVNASGTLGQGHGHLHELPDQHALAKTVALASEHVARPDDLESALDRAFAPFSAGRPGPAHIQIPLDVAGTAAQAGPRAPAAAQPQLDPGEISEAATRLSAAAKVVILAGGGAKRSGANLQALAEHLDAPVVQTVNARGLMHGHPLTVPASPSLQTVRALIEDADCVLALGTELGPTDYDMYATGGMARMAGLIRIDICADQLARHATEIAITACADEAATALLDALPALPKQSQGAVRAARTRTAALEEIGPEYRAQVEMLNAMRNAVPGALMIGDSTQPIYAGNLYYDHDRAGGWFNAATGYGALGYGIPAAIGACGCRSLGPGYLHCRRRRCPILAAGDHGRRGRKPAHHLRALEQPRLWRNRNLDGGRGCPRGRLRPHTAGVRPRCRLLRHPLSDGTHTITASVTDSGGNTSSRQGHRDRRQHR